MRVQVVGTLSLDAKKGNPKVAHTRLRAGCRYMPRRCSALVALNTLGTSEAQGRDLIPYRCQGKLGHAVWARWVRPVAGVEAVSAATMT